MTTSTKMYHSAYTLLLYMVVTVILNKNHYIILKYFNTCKIIINAQQSSIKLLKIKSINILLKKSANFKTTYYL